VPQFQQRRRRATTRFSGALKYPGLISKTRFDSKTTGFGLFG
jgi:hypothetical protein